METTAINEWKMTNEPGKGVQCLTAVAISDGEVTDSFGQRGIRLLKMTTGKNTVTKKIETRITCGLHYGEGFTVAYGIGGQGDLIKALEMVAGRCTQKAVESQHMKWLDKLPDLIAEAKAYYSTRVAPKTPGGRVDLSLLGSADIEALATL